jgi:NADPH2:quinone reductase
MRAVVVDPEAKGHLSVKEVVDPKPGPGEALVRVRAISLNRGEVRAAQAAAAGGRIGWDLAGTIETPATGGGPVAGQRVVGVLRTGAWAELAAVPAPSLAVLPDSVSFEQAATLPVAGLTALHAIKQAGSLLGQKVLVTGASGGVGNFGVQLARSAGAHVVGLVRQEARAASVKTAGAHEVVVDETGEKAAALGPYHLILESVAGQVLANVLKMLAMDGVCVLYGASAGPAVNMDAAAFFRIGRVKLYGLTVFNELANEPAGLGLAVLAGQVAAGKLKPLIEITDSWKNVGEFAQQLIDRRYAGKAVLLVD